MRHECLVRAEDLGPYLLGQLDPAEAARVAEAVTSCASCTAEVQALRPVVVALAYAGPPLDESAAQAPAPALERVLSSVHEERRAQHRRWRTRVYLAAAAVVLLAAAAVGGVVTLRSDSGQREVVLSGATSAAGTADVSAQAWGTAITLKVSGLQPDRSYGAWLADGSGKRVGAGSFRPAADGTARLDLSASLPLDQAGVIGVTELSEGQDVLTARLGDNRALAP